MATCPQCDETLPPAGLSCPECGWSLRTKSAPKRPERARYLEPRTADVVCRIHRGVRLDPTGWCPVAQAWWVPRFACPHCAGPLWDNGYCATCTPRTQTFPGDYFEQTWAAGAGREYGHFVRVHRGPTPVPPPTEVAGFLAELHALVGRSLGLTREPGDEAAVPF